MTYSIHVSSIRVKSGTRLILRGPYWIYYILLDYILLGHNNRGTNRAIHATHRVRVFGTWFLELSVIWRSDWREFRFNNCNLTSSNTDAFRATIDCPSAMETSLNMPSRLLNYRKWKCWPNTCYMGLYK